MKIGLDNVLLIIAILAICFNFLLIVFLIIKRKIEPFPPELVQAHESIASSYKKVLRLLFALSDSQLNQLKLIEDMEARIEERVIAKTSMPPSPITAKEN